MSSHPTTSTTAHRLFGVVIVVCAVTWFGRGLVIASPDSNQWLAWTDQPHDLMDFSSVNSLSYNVDSDHWRVSQTHSHEGQHGATHTIRTRPTVVYKPESFEVIENARLRSLVHGEDVALHWNPTTVQGPDIEDRHTLQELARMAGNAYALPGRKNWYELDEVWNTSFPFGWEDSANGFRGHLFMSSDNSTIVLAIKGTTVQGATSKKDKFNDNLLFSCCCAWVDITWVFATVCNCFSLDWKCDNKCLTNALVKDSLFYSVGVNLFKNVTELYPNANIWLTGHSLGGALASLIGTTFGVPAVAFESPGERLAAQRLHLPSPPLSPVTHVYHTADPIPQGTCTGIGSTCAQAGYALETRCHLGKSIIYDTISRYGWRVDVRKHIIKEVITTVLDDPNDWGEGREVPLATSEEDCVDCYKWEFGDFKEPSGGGIY